MVDEDKIRAALEQEAETAQLPDRVWARVSGTAARPGRRFRFGRLAEAVAVCAVVAGLVGMGTYRATHPQPGQASQQVTHTTLPAALDMKEITSAELKTPDGQSAQLDPRYVLKILSGYNDPKQVRPRDGAARADFTIFIHMQSGKLLSLGVSKGQATIMADYDGAAFWVDSQHLMDVIGRADSVLRPDGVPPAGPLVDAASLAKVSSVKLQGTYGEQRTVTDRPLIAPVTAAVAQATAVTGEPKDSQLSLSLELHIDGSDPILLYYVAADRPYVRRQGTWYTAPGLDQALKPILPPHNLTLDQVNAIARQADPTVEWWPRYEAKGDLNVDGDVVWVAVGLNHRDERVALYLDPVTGKVLRTDAPEPTGPRAIAAVKQFYALTARGEYKAVWDLLHAHARHPNPYLTAAMIQDRLAGRQGKPGPSLVSATAGKMDLDYAKWSTCMCLISDSVQVTAKLSDGSEERIMVAREPDGVWRILWTP